MFRVSRELDFCYGHRLLNYPGKCRHLHGHNGRVLITFEASGLDSQGMVLDFHQIKQTINRWIDDHLDHRMILNREDPVASLLQQHDEPLFLMDANPTGRILIIEDRPESVAWFATALQPGHEVATVDTFEEALVRVRGGDYDLIVVSLGMRG